jgi:hypothetical protein
MKRSLKGLTPGQTETLRALDQLNKKTRAFQTVEDVTIKRLQIRGGHKGRFAQYMTLTHRMLEELSRKGYVDQAQKAGKKTTVMADKRPYRITKKGKEKIKKEDS